MSFAFAAGLAMMGLVLGYMTAGSGSPVVGAVAPSLIGIAVIALNLVQKRGLEQQLGAVVSGSAEEVRASVSRILTADKRESTRQIGWALLIMFFFFLVGAVAGALARTHQWFAPRKTVEVPTLPVPWSDAGKPKSYAEAVEKLLMAAQLRSMGLQREDELFIFSLPVGEKVVAAPVSPTGRSYNVTEPNELSFRLGDVAPVAIVSPPTQAPTAPGPYNPFFRGASAGFDRLQYDRLIKQIQDNPFDHKLDRFLNRREESLLNNKLILPKNDFLQLSPEAQLELQSVQGLDRRD